MQEFSTVNIEQLPAMFQRLEGIFLLDIDQAYNASCVVLARCKQLKVSDSTMARMLLIHSKMLWGKGQYHAAFYSVAQTLKKIRESSSFELKSEAYLWRGLCNLSLKRHVVSVEDFTYSVELALEYSQISIAIEAYVNISQIYFFAGQLDAAREILMIGYRLAVLLNDHKQITKSGIFLANTLNDAGEYANALYLLRQIETSALQHGDMTWVVEVGKTIAISYVALGENELAELYFETMLAIANSNRALWAKSITLVSYGDFLIQQHRYAEGIDCLLGAQEGVNHFNYGYLQQKIAWLQSKAYKENGDFEKALIEIKKYKALSDVVFSNDMLSDLKGKGLNLSRLDRSRKKIYKTRQDFEQMLDLISPGESRARYQQFQYRCASASSEVAILHLQFAGISAVQGQFLQKVSALLREFCIGDSTWTKLPNLAYLLIPEQIGDSPQVMMDHLLEMMNGFPWSWHGLTAPIVDVKLVSPAQATQLLRPIKEGVVEIELLI
ncbi:MAG: tetratricopeptide repeat protein, partial [Deefgea sp.]